MIKHLLLQPNQLSSGLTFYRKSRLMAKETIIKGDQFIRTESYYEALRIMKILQEGLEDIAVDTMSEGRMVDTAIETLQSMVEQCTKSKDLNIYLIPTRLRDMD